MERRCKFTARWCLGKLSPRMRKSSRGRDRDIVFKDNPNPTPKNYRDEAGKETAKHCRALSVHALCKEAVVVLWSTGEIRRGELIKTLGTVGRSTAYAALDQAMESSVSSRSRMAFSASPPSSSLLSETVPQT